MLANRQSTYLKWQFYLPVAVLLAASLLKARQLATSPATANYILDSRLLTLLLIEYELFLAFWLSSCAAQRVARWTAAITFSGFAIVSLRQAFLGEQSCGCFGALAINPWITSSIDILCVVLVCITEPVGRPLRNRVGATAALAGLLMITVAVRVTALATTKITDSGAVQGSGIVVMQPSDWVGKRFPLIRHISEGAQLLDGEWMIVLYHEDCRKCQRVIRSVASQMLESRVAFVEIPPNKSPPPLVSGGIIWLNLTDAHEWFAETPAFVRLKDGIVRDTTKPQWILE